MSALEILTHSSAQTYELGQKLGGLLLNGDLLCLSGELGSGKTTLARGVGAGWGAQEIVNSPTFALVNEYTNARGDRLYHIDAYRLRDAAEAQSIALDDLLDDANGAILIEWAERVQAALPSEGLWIGFLALADQVRHLHLTARGRRYEDLLRQLHLETV